MSNTLQISEKFYSVQAEGDTTGVPAYFIRLKGCNLSCGCSKSQITQIKKCGKDTIKYEDFIGDLVGKSATWFCDSTLTWVFGEKQKYSDITNDWEQLGITDKVNNGQIHIIWTGGEPVIFQDNIADFLYQYNGDHIYNEIETNGTLYIKDELFDWLDQINCSVKLANSGMLPDCRIIHKALNRIIEHKNYWFKFVVSEESDLIEIERDFIKPFNIDPKRVIMMPGLDKQENFHERTKFVLELAKKSGYRGMSRLHISAWDSTTGK